MIKTRIIIHNRLRYSTDNIQNLSFEVIIFSDYTQTANFSLPEFQLISTRGRESMQYFIDDLLLECLPPLDLLLTLDSDFFSALPGVEFFLEEARDPAFNLPTVRDTLPIKVCKKVKIKTN